MIHPTGTDLSVSKCGNRIVADARTADARCTTSTILPKSLLDWVRAQARIEHAKPTQLILRWIERALHRRAAVAGGAGLPARGPRPTRPGSPGSHS